MSGTRLAGAIIDANLYMTLGTADAAGRPWVSPVYHAAAEYREFFWVSEPEATHSRNLATRPELSIVIFDSTVPINTGQGVYMAAVAEELTGAELERGIDSSLADPRSTEDSRGRARTCSRPPACGCTAPPCPSIPCSNANGRAGRR